VPARAPRGRGLAAETDAAVAAAGNVNAGALNMDGIRALAEERREK